MKNIYKYTRSANSIQTVKEMNSEEQPREKLQKYGAESLTNSELLAILLRTGTKEQNVLDLSRSMLEFYGGLHNLARKNHQELCMFKGVAAVKAITLEAVFEFGRRLHSEPDTSRVKFKSPEDVANYFGPKLRHKSKENFYVAFLDNNCTVMASQKISTGSKAATVVDISDVFRLAIIHDASAIVLCHNHPSGIKRVSEQDLNLTKKIMEAAETLHVRVSDHVIICGHDYLSMVQEGLM